jgi:hypothetical protein
MIRKQACDTNDGRGRGRCRAHQQVAHYISPAAQPEIDSERTAQYICRHAITNSNPNGVDGVAERHDWLGINNPAGKGNGETD